MTIYFARTRHEYGSYVDLWRLVELSGFAQCFLDEMEPDNSDNIYIIPVRNGELPTAGYPSATARIIHWNLEWCEYPPLPGISEVWNSDAWYASKIGARYVPMGSHPGLSATPGWREPSPPDIVYDVAYLGYMVGRRERISFELQALGVTTTPTSAWGMERHELLSKSRTYLHIHQLADAPGVPPLRMVVAAAYGLPMICENVANLGIFHYPYMTTEKYSEIARVTSLFTKHGGMSDHQWLIDSSAALHTLLCEQLTFRKSVEAAL